jgi:hypothetical protein
MKWYSMHNFVVFSYYEKKNNYPPVSLFYFKNTKIALHYVHGKMSVNHERFLFIILRTKLKKTILNLPSTKKTNMYQK